MARAERPRPDLSAVRCSITVRTMSNSGTGNIGPVRPGIGIATVVAAALVLPACVMTRDGPPAPVIDRSGIYYTAPAADTPPVTAAPRRGISSVAIDPVPRRDSITRAPVTKESKQQTAALPRLPPSPGRDTPAGGTISRQGGSRVTVQTGETLYAISRRERVPLRALIDANRLRPPYALRVGQTLSVPSVRVYVVAPGDTVSAVARRHDASVSEVIRQNDLKAPDFGLFAGQRLVLPWRGAGGQELRNPAPPPQASIRRPPDPPSPHIELADPDAEPPKRASSKFLWPVRGKVVSGFGSKGGGLYNDGINIAAEDGAIVRAADNGIVAYAGNELRGYGNLLLVRHAGGWISAYAHNGELLVRRGQVIKRGQPIAKVGRSGAVAAPQLHFELRRGRKAVDPRPHLS